LQTPYRNNTSAFVDCQQERNAIGLSRAAKIDRRFGYYQTDGQLARHKAMLRDFRIAFRVLAARPGFTLVAALSLALGIGANSAIFTLVDALWFRPLAVANAERMVHIVGVTDQDREAPLSYPEYLEFKQASAFSDVVVIGGRGAMLIEGDRPELHNLYMVSSNFFTGLGVKSALGRVFTPKDDASPDALIVVLGNSFWRRHYGADPNIVGKQIRIQRLRELLVTVIGVLPETFRDIDRRGDCDLWFPEQMWPALGDAGELQARGNRWFSVLGTLAPGASAQSANVQVQDIARRMGESWPATNRERRAVVITDLNYRLERAGTNGLALLAIVALVVVISSVNVANLLLSRAGARSREMAVRLAIGAGRARIVRQLMAENLLLGLAGLMLGLAIGAALTEALPSMIMQPPGFYVPVDFNFDSRVFQFSLGVSLATVVLFGLAPAWKCARTDLLAALKGDAPFAGGGRRWPLRNWFTVAQIGVSLALVASACVLARSFFNTRVSDLGFGRKPLLLVWLTADMKPPVYRDAISHLQGLPGVRSVALAVRAPLSLSSNGMFKFVTVPGRPEIAEVKYNSITPNFLDTMGTPILRGRGFDKSDENPGATSVLINERMAQRFFAGENPVGKTIRVGSQRRDHTVVGVVKNAPINAVGEPPEPYLYLSYWANFESEVTFLVETSADPTALAQAVRRELKAVNARLEPSTITTENELIRYSAQQYQVTAELAGSLGVLGLILTAVGLYGVISYGISQRTRELGIRMALGADRGDTLRLVLQEVAMVGVVGMAAGLPLALVANRLLSSLLFGVSPWDAPTLAAAAGLLAAVLFGAGFLSARRATAIEPASALRCT
jgi:predicted permease